MHSQPTNPVGICQQCNNQFVFRRADRPTKFCSSACYTASRSLSPVVCGTCGVTFRPRDYKRLFCTHRCYAQSLCTSPDLRFWAKVNKDGPTPAHCLELGPCWLWTGGISKAGYGRFAPGNSQPMIGAHCYAYTLAHGPVPEGLFICHHCDNPRCVRVTHLFPGTNSANILDSIEKGRMPIGEESHKAKLTENDVREMRHLRYNDGLSYTAIGKTFGVSKVAARNAVMGRTWKHVM
jgi:hypothetical protein